MSDGTDPDDRVFAERFRHAYQATPLPEPEALRQVAARAVAGRLPRRRTSGLGAWFEPTLSLRPAVALAAAMALFAGGAFVSHRLESRGGHVPMPGPAGAARAPTQAVRFVFVDRTASRVALAGDFNGWDAGAAPLRSQPNGGAWSITLDLTPGWHSYAFVVDGAAWVPDPHAPRAPADDFGTLRSVVVVGEYGT